MSTSSLETRSRPVGYIYITCMLDVLQCSGVNASWTREHVMPFFSRPMKTREAFSRLAEDSFRPGRVEKCHVTWIFDACAGNYGGSICAKNRIKV